MRRKTQQKRNYRYHSNSVPHGAASELVAAAESPSPSATVQAAGMSLTGERGEDGSVAAVDTGQGSMSHYYTLDGAWELPNLFFSVQALRRFGMVTMYWPHEAPPPPMQADPESVGVDAVMLAMKSPLVFAVLTGENQICILHSLQFVPSKRHGNEDDEKRNNQQRGDNEEEGSPGSSSTTISSITTTAEAGATKGSTGTSTARAAINQHYYDATRQEIDSQLVGLVGNDLISCAPLVIDNKKAFEAVTITCPTKEVIVGCGGHGNWPCPMYHMGPFVSGNSAVNDLTVRRTLLMPYREAKYILDSTDEDSGVLDMPGFYEKFVKDKYQSSNEQVAHTWHATGEWFRAASVRDYSGRLPLQSETISVTHPLSAQRIQKWREVVKQYHIAKWQEHHR